MLTCKLVGLGNTTRISTNYVQKIFPYVEGHFALQLEILAKFSISHSWIEEKS